MFKNNNFVLCIAWLLFVLVYKFCLLIRGAWTITSGQI